MVSCELSCVAQFPCSRQRVATKNFCVFDFIVKYDGSQLLRRYADQYAARGSVAASVFVLRIRRIDKFDACLQKVS